MQNAATARVFLQRLRPWVVSKAVHARWATRRASFQSDLDSLLQALDGERGRLTPALRLRVEGYLGHLHKEWFPKTWRPRPTFAEVLADFRWWLGIAERWFEPPAKRARTRRTRDPLAEQPEQLCRMLGLPADCTAGQFRARWRLFLKRNHPDLNPDQTPDERRRFAEALALWRR
jgi:hypothetical protein